MTVLVGEVFVALRPEMAGFNREVESKINALSSTSGGSGSLGGLMNKIGKATTIGLAAAVTGSVALAMDMQKSQAQLQGTMGISAKKAAAIGNALLGTAGQSTYSGNQMMKAFAPVGGQLKIIDGHALSAAQSLSFMTTASKLADATNQDLTGNTAALAQILQAFQLKTKDAGNAANTLYTTSNATGVGISSLSTTVSQLHMKLGDLDPSLKGISTLMVDLAEHGTVGSRGVKAVSSGLEHLIDVSSKTPTAMAAAIKSATDANTSAAQSLADAQTHLTQLQNVDNANGGASTLSQQYALTNAQTAVTVAQQKATEAQQNLTAAQKGNQATSSTATATLTKLGISLYNSHHQFIGMRNLVTELKPKLDQLHGSARQLALSNLFGAGAAQQMNKIIEAGGGAFDKAATAVMKHNAVTRAAAAYQHTLKGQLETARAAAVDLATRLGRVLIPILGDVIRWTTDTVKWFEKNKLAAEVLGGVIATILGASMIHFAAQTTKKFVDAVAKDITGILNLGKASEKSAGRVTLASGEYMDSMGRMHAADGKFISSTPELEAAFEDQAAGAEESAGGFDIASAAMDAIPIFALIAASTLLLTHWKLVWEGIKIMALTAYHFLDNDVLHPIEHGFDAVINFVKTHWKMLLPILAGPFGPVLFVVLNFHKQIVHVITDVINWFKKVPVEIIKAFFGLNLQLLKIGTELIMGLVHGIEKGFDVVRHTIAHLGHNIVGWAKDALGVFSPSKHFAEIGGHLMEGLALGITNNQHLAQKAINGINLTVPHIGTGSSGASTTQHQMLTALQALVTETRSNTAALMALTAQEKRPLKAIVTGGGSASDSNKALAVALAR